MSKKLHARLSTLRYAGYFLAKEAEEKGVRLVTGREGNLCFYWLVDEADGVIADARFQAFGPPPLLAAADLLSELALRKTYDQVSRISADFLDAQARDKKESPAFPPPYATLLNQVLAAVDRAVHQCLDIPFAASHDLTPIEADLASGSGIPDWDSLPKDKQLLLIEEVISKEVRPYVELDAGNVKVVDLQHTVVTIRYEGSCTSCHSSVGSTLTAIQQILRARLSPTLTIVPESFNVS
jgi:NifU-like protein